MPKVSAVMSVYNAERYVEEAIESILGQTFRASMLAEGMRASDLKFRGIRETLRYDSCWLVKRGSLRKTAQAPTG